MKQVYEELDGAICGVFALGLLSFGGPVAHIGYFREEFVLRRKWLSEQTYADIVALCQFLPGAAQALPGPLFTFAAYLGTVMLPGEHAWMGGLVAMTALLLPSMFLVIGALPYWNALRSQPACQAALKGANAALKGANAAVVGILMAALGAALLG